MLSSIYAGILGAIIGWTFAFTVMATSGASAGWTVIGASVWAWLTFLRVSLYEVNLWRKQRQAA